MGGWRRRGGGWSCWDKKSRVLVGHPAEEHPQVARRIPLVVVEEPMFSKISTPADRHVLTRRSPNRKLDNVPASAAAPDPPRWAGWIANSLAQILPVHRPY